MKEKKLELVVIEWEDSLHKSGWVFPEEAEKFHSPPKIENVGYVFKADKQGITLVNGVSDTCYAGLFFIPRSQIKKIRKVKY